MLVPSQFPLGPQGLGFVEPRDEPLAERECGDGQEERGPLGGVDLPVTQRSGFLGHQASCNAQPGLRAALADLPDETVEVEVEQGRGPDDGDQDVLQRDDRDALLQAADKAVADDQSDIEPEHRCTAAEQESREAANVGVAVDPFAVEDPDDGQILNVVKDLEDRDPEQDVVDLDHRVPPVGETDGEGQQLEDVGGVAGGAT